MVIAMFAFMKKIIIFILYSSLLFLSRSASYAQDKNKDLNVVRGVVLSKDTQLPLYEAVVSVVGDTLLCVTDKEGRFELKGLKSGYNRIDILAIGFSSVVSESFLVSSFAPIELEFEMDILTYYAGEVTVVAAPLKLSAEAPVSLRKIEGEEIDLTPGANRDISKVVQLSPGVVPVSFGNRNDVLVRGGGANENKYFLDGIEIPVLNHFSVQGGSGGYASLVNTELLSNVKFYTGAFPSEFTNGLSSVLDMQMKTGNSDKFHGKLVVGASDVGISVDTPVSKNGKTTLTASYRRSYLQLLFGILKLPFLPTYNDYQFKLNTKLSDRDELYFIGLGSFDKNKLNLSIENPDRGQEYILGYIPNNDQNSYVIGTGYDHTFDNGSLNVVLSRNYLKNVLYKYQDNDSSMDKVLNIDSKEVDYRFRSEVKLRNLGGFRLKVGIGASYGSMESSTYQQVFVNDNVVLQDYDNNIDFWRYSMFGTLSRQFFNDKLFATFAFRVDGMSYSPLTNNPFKQFSPRLSLLYKFAPRWNLGASVGRYYQEPSRVTMAYKDMSADNVIDGTTQEDRLKYVGVDSYVLGVDFSPNKNSMVKIEGFYKQYFNTPISLVDSLPVSTSNFEDFIVGNVPVASVGKGRAYGMELSYRNVDLKNTVINVSYTYMYSQVSELDANLTPIKGAFVASSWDVRNILNITAIHKFGRNWSLGAKWYLVSGMPYTPYDYELSSNINAWDARNRPYVDNSKYNTERSKTYHQLDLRIDKVWDFKKWRLRLYVDVQNVYNYKASAQSQLMPDMDSNGNFVVNPNKPGHYNMIELENSFGGTILPTIGISIEM